MGRRRRPEDPEYLTESQRVNIAKDRLRAETEKALFEAIVDAQKCGYGFIGLRKMNGSLDMVVRHLSWHMVIDAMREIGALGGGGIR